MHDRRVAFLRQAQALGDAVAARVVVGTPGREDDGRLRVLVHQVAGPQDRQAADDRPVQPGVVVQEPQQPPGRVPRVYRAHGLRRLAREAAGADQ
jgi:hypothetical protein